MGAIIMYSSYNGFSHNIYRLVLDHLTEVILCILPHNVFSLHFTSLYLTTSYLLFQRYNEKSLDNPSTIIEKFVCLPLTAKFKNGSEYHGINGLNCGVH